MKAWHFLTADRHTGCGNILVKTGETQRVDPPAILCCNGLHASLKVLDALHYAPGPVVCRVEIGGQVTRGDDKLVATERTSLWMYNATDVLVRFARLCALDVAHLWGAPPEVVRCLRTGAGSKRYRKDLRDPAWAVIQEERRRTPSGASVRAYAAAAALGALAAKDWAVPRESLESCKYAIQAGANRDALNRRLTRMILEGRPR